MLEIAHIHLFVFGVFSILGGVIGFVKAKSKPSLIAGAGSGVLLLGCGAAISMAHAMVGLIVGLLISLALAGRFVPAFRKTKKVMPAGVMAFLSIVGIVLTIAALAHP